MNGTEITKMEETDDKLVNLAEFKARPKPAMKPPSGPDWLSAIKSGTEFLVRDKTGSLTPRFLVLEWIHGGLHPTGNVLLLPAKSPNDNKTWQWVDPIEFCKLFDNRGIIWESEDDN